MKLQAVILLGLGLVTYTAATQSVVWVTETAYTCPCSSSTTSLISATVHSSGAFQSSATKTSTSLTAAQTCLASGADCSGQTATYGCCSLLTCDSTTLTCVPKDTSGSTDSDTSVLGSSATSVSTPTSASSSLAAVQTCLAQNADCSGQTATFGCCSPLTCDSTTLTCVPEN